MHSLLMVSTPPPPNTKIFSEQQFQPSITQKHAKLLTAFLLFYWIKVCIRFILHDVSSPRHTSKHIWQLDSIWMYCRSLQHFLAQLNRMDKKRWHQQTKTETESGNADEERTWSDKCPSQNCDHKQDDLVAWTAYTNAQLTHADTETATFQTVTNWHQSSSCI